MGIDPGYERLGIALVGKTTGKEVLVYSECFQTSAKEKHPERLRQLGSEIESTINKFKPGVLAIETLFFQNNQKTAMKVAEVRGLIIYIAKKLGLEVREFTPMEIKVAVTGYGKSDKKQVILMVEKLVKIDKKIKHDDEYDAIASPLTAFAIHS
jgi:crossover junction endodeoxyribonuclease RuvC